MSHAIIRRFKPVAGFSAVGRLLHEIRLMADGRAIYWVQPTEADQGKLHSEIVFAHFDMADFDLAVSRGELMEVAVPAAC